MRLAVTAGGYSAMGFFITLGGPQAHDSFGLHRLRNHCAALIRRTRFRVCFVRNECKILTSDCNAETAPYNVGHRFLVS